MNSRSFILDIRQKLDPIAPIVLPGIIKKQLTEVHATEDTLTPELAEEFIRKMEEALTAFLGPEGAKLVHQMMMKELRKYAPDYFEEHSLI
ncbi:MAG: hypothetical protein JSV56_03250 [Methanomassiliicoccales archaeon]|nr:MAG: hypothetical protein JSV56_03250 [Methanomassiliicoccales archaeon]